MGDILKTEGGELSDFEDLKGKLFNTQQVLSLDSLFTKRDNEKVTK